jgi:hypothetical protein
MICENYSGATPAVARMLIFAHVHDSKSDMSGFFPSDDIARTTLYSITFLTVMFLRKVFQSNERYSKLNDMRLLSI